MRKYFLLFFLFSFCMMRAGEISVLFTGDYPDPSIIKVDNKYYMTHTSNSYSPGLLIWESEDLKNWRRVCRALTQNIGAVWAPELVYYDSRYYIYFPVDAEVYVITASQPEGPWSAPEKIGAQGIDPGHVVGKDGKRYIYVDQGRVAELSADGMKVVSPFEDVYEGWIYPDDWIVECFCLESPKVIYHEGYYYLISAQGGTSGPATSHMAVVARARSCLGPWENSPYNPLIHTFSTDDRWISKGHATLFQADKDWYAVYHAYLNGHRELGRCTLMVKIRWTKDGWPVSESDMKNDSENTYRIYENSYLKNDDFDGSELDLQWSFWGCDGPYDYEQSNGELILNADVSKLRALLAIAPCTDYEVSFKIQIEGDVSAGLALLYNDQEFVGLGLEKNLMYGLLHGKKFGEEIVGDLPAYYRLKIEDYTVSVYYSRDGKNWTMYPQGFEVSGYHTNMLSGFLTLKPAVFCKGNGRVYIDNFKFQKIR